MIVFTLRLLCTHGTHNANMNCTAPHAEDDTRSLPDSLPGAQGAQTAHDTVTQCRAPCTVHRDQSARDREATWGGAMPRLARGCMDAVRASGESSMRCCCCAAFYSSEAWPSRQMGDTGREKSTWMSSSSCTFMAGVPDDTKKAEEPVAMLFVRQLATSGDTSGGGSGDTALAEGSAVLAAERLWKLRLGAWHP